MDRDHDTVFDIETSTTMWLERKAVASYAQHYLHMSFDPTLFLRPCFHRSRYVRPHIFMAVYLTGAAIHKFLYQYYRLLLSVQIMESFNHSYIQSRNTKNHLWTNSISGSSFINVTSTSDIVPSHDC